MSKATKLQIEGLQDQLDDTEGERDELQGKLDALERQFSDLKKNNVTVATRLAAKESQVKTLEKCIDLIKFMTELRISKDMGLKPTDCF